MLQDYDVSHITDITFQRKDDFHSVAISHAAQTYRSLDEREKTQVVSEVAEVLSRCRPVIQEKMIRAFAAYDNDYGQRLAKALLKLEQENSDIIPDVL